MPPASAPAPQEGPPPPARAANVVRRFAEKAHKDASTEELYFHLAVAVALATQNTDVYTGMGKLQTAMHGFQEAETGLIRTLMYQPKSP